MTEYSGGKKGLIIKFRPSRYKRTEQQSKLAEVVKECGIEKGINRKELREKMIKCVGPRMRETSQKE